MMRKLIAGLVVVLGVSGCTAVPTTQEPVASAAIPQKQVSANTGNAETGRTFAQMRCATCHAVGPNQVSPNTMAPAFEAIANTRGLTEKTLSVWLRDSHNYPEMMNFEIDAKHIDDLAAHMLTLQSSDYTPLPQ